MRKSLLFILCIFLLCSHDLYIKMDSYFLQAKTEATLHLYNGTFLKSENVITRDRMLDASILANGERSAIDSSQWVDKDSITSLNFSTGLPGTYVVGVSTAARNIELSAEKFNSYLKHDGVLDMLALRETDSTLDQRAVEKYAKHVKGIFQVGDATSADWSTALGYPIEFVPLENPYKKYAGDNLKVQLLMNGKPLENQLVYANQIASKHGHSHKDESHSHGGATHSHTTKDHQHDDTSSDDHTHTSGQKLRTDKDGMFEVSLPSDGIYYLRTIHMIKSNKEGLTHESNWATLSFEVTHKHKHDSTTHTHKEPQSIPSWVFWLGSLLVIAVLFLVFRKK